MNVTYFETNEFHEWAMDEYYDEICGICKDIYGHTNSCPNTLCEGRHCDSVIGDYAYDNFIWIYPIVEAVI